MTDDELVSAIHEALNMSVRSKRFKAVRDALKQEGRWKQLKRGRHARKLK